MTKDEALKLALSALNDVRQETFHAEKKVWEAIYTIKKVLSQPQHEWVGLTKEEINLLAKAYSTMEGELNAPAFARAILRRAQEK